MINVVVQMRKFRLRDIKYLVQCHTTGKKLEVDFNVRLLGLFCFESGSCFVAQADASPHVCMCVHVCEHVSNGIWKNIGYPHDFFSGASHLLFRTGSH